MKNSNITTLTRLAVSIGGLSLLAVLFTPIWRIDLYAPQYPEGLKLLIYATKLAGNVDIINGLNHYIGMKTLRDSDFLEFKILPAIIVLFSVCFIVVGFVGRRKWLNIAFAAFVVFGIVAMVDFWRWEYDYGHDLNPDAAIIVPGMAYQPPLIGFKQLLNFGAYSMPDIGGWIFLIVGVILLCSVVYEWRRATKQVLPVRMAALLVLSVPTLLLSGCSIDAQPIRIGKDNCEFCKMTISDKRFGAEVITKKGKAYKFDDEHCIMAFLQSAKIARQDVAAVYFADFTSPHTLVNVEQAYFLQSPSLKSPMNGNIAAFRHEDSLHKVLPRFYGNKISWEDMQK